MRRKLVSEDNNMFKEVDFNEITNYKDPLSLFKEGAVAVVEDKEKANPITIGWGSLGTLWGMPMCTVYIHEKRYSKHMFDETNYFSVCFFKKEYDDIVNNIFGNMSGKDKDKIKLSNMTLSHISNTPYLEEAELVIICKKVGQTQFDSDNVPDGRMKEWYKRSGTHSIYCGEIIKVLKNIL